MIADGDGRLYVTSYERSLTANAYFHRCSPSGNDDAPWTCTLERITENEPAGSGYGPAPFLDYYRRAVGVVMTSESEGLRAVVVFCSFTSGCFGGPPNGDDVPVDSAYFTSPVLMPGGLGAVLAIGATTFDTVSTYRPTLLVTSFEGYETYAQTQ